MKQTLLRARRSPSLDPRVKRVLRSLPNRLAGEEDVSLDAVAASVQAVAVRFMHLFTGVGRRPVTAMRALASLAARGR